MTLDELANVLQLLGALALGMGPVAAYVLDRLAFFDVIVILVGMILSTLVLIHWEVGRS